MSNKLMEIFFPSPERIAKMREIAKEIHDTEKLKKGCVTCSHCHHVYNYPGFVTAEECECDAELECDTVCYSIENCPKWEEDTDEVYG